MTIPRLLPLLGAIPPTQFLAKVCSNLPKTLWKLDATRMSLKQTQLLAKALARDLAAVTRFFPRRKAAFTPTAKDALPTLAAISSPPAAKMHHPPIWRASALPRILPKTQSLANCNARPWSVAIPKRIRARLPTFMRASIILLAKIFVEMIWRCPFLNWTFSNNCAFLAWSLPLDNKRIVTRCVNQPRAAGIQTQAVWKATFSHACSMDVATSWSFRPLEKPYLPQMCRMEVLTSLALPLMLRLTPLPANQLVPMEAVAPT